MLADWTFQLRCSSSIFVLKLFTVFFCSFLFELQIRIPLNVSFKVKGRDVMVDIQQSVSVSHKKCLVSFFIRVPDRFWMRAAFRSTKNSWNSGKKFWKFVYTSWGCPNIPEFQTAIFGRMESARGIAMGQCIGPHQILRRFPLVCRVRYM